MLLGQDSRREIGGVGRGFEMGSCWGQGAELRTTLEYSI